jgi:hypothetical protein
MWKELNVKAHITVLTALGVWLAIGTRLALGSLEIYEDGVKYRYIPVDNYVGFVRGASALCGEREIALISRQQCPEAKRLCKEKKHLDELEMERQSIEDTLSIIDRWITSAKLNNLEATKWIGAAEKIGKRRAEWQKRQQEMDAEVQSVRQRFQRQVSSNTPSFLSRLCKEELELTLPAGLIDIRLINVAALGEKKLSISHELSLRNRSGVDISSKDARIYARKFRRTLRPLHFNPWIVRPRPKKGTSRIGAPLSTSRVRLMKKVEEEAMPSPALSTPRRLAYRNYAIGHIELPSTGEEVRVPVNRYEVPRRCEEISYPWRDPSVYLACRFSPKTPIEENSWILKEGRRIVSEHTYGEYDRGKYLLYIDRDDTVVIRRRRLVERERSSGIFGGKIRRKDGYTLQINNKSDRQKTIKIVERIPRSTTEAIEVKLLKLQGAIQESLDEDGKLVMQVVLAPREHKEVKVLFELIYDKELKVRY